MRQGTFAETEFERFGKPTRRAVFLAEMDRVLPWADLVSLIEPYYPKRGNGRPPIGLERMLRIHFMQHWYNLSDPAMEETLFESQSARRFAGIDLGHEVVPDETTICKFRHLLERHDLGRAIFERVNACLAARGIKIGTGTIVDATIIAAPSSTKNANGTRDPEMRQTKKGNQWYFGMKGHFGVDSRTKLIHSVVATAANVHDGTVLSALLHGSERRVWGDTAYTGRGAVIRAKAHAAADWTQRRYRFRGIVNKTVRERNRTKSRIRSRVEHSIGVIKRVFGFARVRYRGLWKNEQRLFVASALANVYLVRRRLLTV